MKPNQNGEYCFPAYISIEFAKEINDFLNDLPIKISKKSFAENAFKAYLKILKNQFNNLSI